MKDKMNPTKSAFDYMTEMNRLFPRNDLNDVFRLSSNPTISPFSQSTPAISSSSTESTPPDMYPDMSHIIQPRDYETPYVIRRQRPIVGRRLMTEPTLDQKQKSPKSEEYDFPNIWQFDESPVSQNYLPPLQDQRSQNYYELFPAENKGFELRSPVKNSEFNVSPSHLTASPSLSNVSSSSPNIGPFYPSSPNIGSPVYGPSSSKYPERPRICTFCRKNGETPLVYMTHTVKQNVGNRNIVTCPILRSHVCATCGASGDDAHTITYCPVLRSTNNGLPLQSTTITLKNTRVKSNGRRRY